MSRVVLWTPFYAPEFMGIPPLVTDAAEWLSERGHHVDVVTGLPNYPRRVIEPGYEGKIWTHERRAGVDVFRSWLWVRREQGFLDKALWETSFAVVSLPRVLKRAASADVVVCVVPSLAAAAAAAVFVHALRGARRGRPELVVWVQDLVLEAAASLENVGGAGAKLLRLAQVLERAAFNAADRIVVCSPGFRDYIAGLGVAARSVETIYNWVDVNEYYASPANGNGSRTRFLYAGNLGYTQGFETLIEAAERAGPEVAVQVVGDGNTADEVRRLAEPVANVAVSPALPRSEVPHLLASADVHVVIQRRLVAGANLPSKIAVCLASGRPIVASIDEETPAAKLLEASQGAVVVPPDDPDRLAEAMLELHRRPELRRELGERGREFAVRTLSHERVLARLEHALLG